MKWLKRGCWLVAWCIWLWLGVGLYHELPREVGPVVCRIPVAPYRDHRTYCLGFDGPNRVVVADLPAIGPKRVNVYDAESGDRVAEFPAPNLEWRWTWRDARLHHGRLIANERERGGLKALDLSIGVCHTIQARGVLGFTLHPTESLVAFVSSLDDATGRRLAGYDLNARRLMFETDLSNDGGRLDTPLFVPGKDKLLVMSSSPDGYFFPAAGTPIRVCTIPAPGAKAAVERFEIGPPDRGWATASQTGRVVFGAAESGAFEVFDFTQNRVMFSRPATAKGSPVAPIGATQNPPSLSADGRTVIGDWPQTLWDLDAGMPLWKAGSLNFAFPDLSRASTASVGTRFFVLEFWSELWKPWIPKAHFTTWACRDMRDGSLLYRLYRPVGDGSYNADWTLVVGDEGMVYRLPPHVNWILLTLCQAILALPLIVLWTVLRWRRRRAARRQPAVALESSVSS